MSDDLSDTVTSVAGPQALVAALPRGTCVDRYVIIELIGEGAMGRVYKAADPDLDRVVALKIVAAKDTSDDASAGSRGRLLREAHVLAKLAHPNVVTVHDAGTFGDEVFIAMELVEGTPLGQWLAAARRSWREIVAAFLAAGHGLAAAHAAGVVHRDVKPANLVVGNDGRVRVVDFGVARLSSVGAGDDPAATGAVVGTPAYMAPEQQSGGEVGPASDQFSFCVALFEALYGVRPFRGATVEEVWSAVAQGLLQPPPPEARVPKRLHGAIVRGLAAQPADRYPSMEALLAELGREPTAARVRRALIPALATLLVVGVVIAVWFGLRSRAEWREQRARENAAAAHWEAIRRRIADLESAGRSSAADEAFLYFARLDEHRGTEALARAWLERAAATHRTGRFDEALDAYAAAYAVARRPDEQTEALMGLAHAFLGRWAHTPLAIVLDTLAAHQGVGGRQEEIMQLRAASALGRRDLAGALVHLREPDGVAPLIAALSAMTRTPHRADSVVAGDVRGEGRAEILVRTDRRLLVLGVGPGLPVLGAYDVPPELGTPRSLFVVPVPGERAFLLGTHDTAAGREGALYRLGRGGIDVAHRWAENWVLSGVTADLDGDGATEVYIGSGSYARTLREWRAGGLVAVEPADDLAESDIAALAAADLDGDGHVELVMSAGPWGAFDVRVFRRDPGASRVRMVARRRLGYVTGLATLPDRARPGRLLIAASKTDEFPSRLVFPDAPHTGEAPGIYLLRLEQGSLEIAAFLPARPGGAQGERLLVGGVLAGDFDGDGRTDLVAPLDGPDKAPYALLYRQRADGTFAGALAGGLVPLAVLSVDGDPAAKLLARLPDDEEHLWLLGAGHDAAPLLEARRLAAGPQAIPGDVTDSTLYRSWERAEQLVRMGLPVPGAAAFDDLAALAGETPEGRRALYRAGQLYEAAGDDARAAARYEASALGATAGWDAAHSHLRAHRFADALRLYEDLAGRAEVPPDVRERARAQADIVRPLVQDASHLRIDFTTPLDGAWLIEDPIALTRDPQAQVLRVEAFNDVSRIAAYPLSCGAVRRSLAVRFGVLRSEWASGISIALQPRGGPPSQRVALVVRGMGGGGFLSQEIGCLPAGKDVPGGRRQQDVVVGFKRPIDGPAASAELHAEIAVVAALDETFCRLSDPEGRELSRDRIPLGIPLVAGDYELVIQAHGDPGIREPVWTSLGIHSIEVGGCTPAAGQAVDALREGHRRLVDGDLEGAQRAYLGAGPQGTVGRSMVYASLGRDSLAIAELRDAARRGGAEDKVAFDHLMRARAPVFVPLLKAALGASFYERYVVAWRTPWGMHPADALIQRSLIADLGGLHDAADVPPAIKLSLLSARAQAFRQIGNIGPARADLERAVAIGSALLAGRAPVDEARAELEITHRILAALEATAGNDARALEHVHAALALSRRRTLTIEALRALGELAPMRGRPGWEIVFGR